MELRKDQNRTAVTLSLALAALMLFFAIIAFGCDTDQSVQNNRVTTINENVSDLQNRLGCILLELKVIQGSDTIKVYYWVTDYFESNGFLVLYNESGFLISLDLNSIVDLKATNYCNNPK